MSVSVVPISDGRFGGNETRSDGVTAVTETRYIKGLSEVGQHKEILSIICKYLDRWSFKTRVGYSGKLIQKDVGNTQPHHRNMV